MPRLTWYNDRFTKIVILDEFLIVIGTRNTDNCGRTFGLSEFLHALTRAILNVDFHIFSNCDMRL